MNRTWDIDELRKFIKSESSGGSSQEEIVKLWENSDLSEYGNGEINFLESKIKLADYNTLIFTYLENARGSTLVESLKIKIYKTAFRKVKTFFILPVDNGQLVRFIDVETYSNKIIINNCIKYDYINKTQEKETTGLIPYEIYGIISNQSSIK